MSSDMTPLGGFPAVRRWLMKGEERRAWEEANPDLALAWTIAMHEDEERTRVRQDACRADYMRQDAVHQLRRLGVPERAAATLANLNEDRPGLRAVRAWMAPPPTEAKPKALLLLLGETGTGKTVAAAYAALQAISAHRPGPTGSPTDIVVWAAAADLSALSTFTESDKDWLERMKRCRLLVLDDLGSEAVHEHAQQRLDRLIDERYGNNRLTVITSNASVDIFKQRVGARIADRMREAGRVVNCGNQSLRGVK